MLSKSVMAQAIAGREATIGDELRLTIEWNHPPGPQKVFEESIANGSRAGPRDIRNC